MSYLTCTQEEVLMNAKLLNPEGNSIRVLSSERKKKDYNRSLLVM